MSTDTEAKTKNLPVPADGHRRDVARGFERTPVIAEFQSDAVELEERVPPRIARLTLYGVTALIGAAVLWASLSSIDEVVVAPGKLITTEPTIVLQPLETSIIRSIDVAAGDVVHAGQTLATLDATFSQSDVDQQRAKFAALDAQVKRLEAELAGRDYATVAGSTPDEQLQLQLFEQRRAFRIAQLDNFDQQMAAQNAAIAAGKDQAAILDRRRDGLVQIEEARETLYKQETGSLLNLLSSRDARLDVEASIAQLRGKETEATYALAKLEADRRAFIEDFRRATSEQLVERRNERDAAGEELKKMELRRNMVALTAPADAVVLDMAQRSVGSVVREAEPIVTLVPLDVPLEAEVSVNARDIGRIEVDEPARIKFDAYPFQKYGTASGSIRTISQDAFAPDPKGGQTETAELPFFKARVLLGDKRLDGSGEEVRLLPGMAVTAEIKVGRRTVISYFLYPLIRGLDDSIREP
ncbi:HlyD family type I secretion periplasmic adaptor subunit [Mesorhizobium sp. L-8-3]|uniref:HlyD family type I secretion periplasmic adaptor subunit n=1 Tax=Mesorhizobium sp. L-8-3 TaxID=2744522 RepID=UPI001925FDD8|nr:HlyD family type I secretion periplasmic adaptor subunit [Mesorhizobium sp. L-8-3]BCH27585.1 HlyD family type I secretion periplasmic adaptor subunit [Mesorhizobium sp. L-8-3]